MHTCSIHSARIVANRGESWACSARSTRLQNHSQAISDQTPSDPLGDKHRGTLSIEYTEFAQYFQKLFIFWYKTSCLCNNIFNLLLFYNSLEVLNNTGTIVSFYLYVYIWHTQIRVSFWNIFNTCTFYKGPSLDKSSLGRRGADYTNYTTFFLKISAINF